MRVAFPFLVLVLAACGTADGPDTPADGEAADSGAPVVASARPETLVDTASGDTLVFGAEQTQDAPVRLVAMVPGDRACYLTVDGADGQRTEMADVNFCERDDLVGQRVTLTTVPTQIQAESCQGNPECTETETVTLVVSADLVEE